MTLENSPRIQKPDQSRPASLRDWLIQRKRVFFVGLLALLVGWLVFVAVIVVKNSAVKQSPGGLEGYVLSQTGAPLAAQLSIADVTTQTYEDGYFFFNSLPAGTAELVIKSGGKEMRQPVTILSDQAVNLGRIILDGNTQP